MNRSPLRLVLVVCALLLSQAAMVVGQAPAPLYLPAVHNFDSPPGLYGLLVQSGAPVGGLQVGLARYTLGNLDSTSYIVTSTTTADGRYGFANVPALAANQAYFVRWVNPSQTYANRAFAAFSGDIRAFTGTVPARFAALDIADIVLIGPIPPPAGVDLPLTLTWTPRSATPGDSYRVRFFSADFADLLAITPTLGYTGGYTLTALPAGMTRAVNYQWDAIADGPDGSLVIPWSTLEIRFVPAASASGARQIAPDISRWPAQREQALSGLAP